MVLGQILVKGCFEETGGASHDFQILPPVTNCPQKGWRTKWKQKASEVSWTSCKTTSQRLCQKRQKQRQLYSTALSNRSCQHGFCIDNVFQGVILHCLVSFIFGQLQAVPSHCEMLPSWFGKSVFFLFCSLRIGVNDYISYAERSIWVKKIHIW